MRWATTRCPRLGPSSAARAPAARRDDHARAPGAASGRAVAARDTPSGPHARAPSTKPARPSRRSTCPSRAPWFGPAQSAAREHGDYGAVAHLDAASHRLPGAATAGGRMSDAMGEEMLSADDHARATGAGVAQAVGRARHVHAARRNDQPGGQRWGPRPRQTERDTLPAPAAVSLPRRPTARPATRRGSSRTPFPPGATPGSRGRLSQQLDKVFNV
jgi:hypothetical protein